MESQKVTIQIDALSAAKLQKRANAQGITVDELLRIIADGMNGGQNPSSVEMTPEERAREFEQWVTQHSVKGVIADDSRESIYTREDEAL
ncbi:MAG: hypothetical protein MOB07_01495 [Acidobacteria bacterium]|nr:hypothetical protein [Acidobacteriota bacterium]